MRPLIATALALGVILLTPTLCSAGEKSPADRGAADRAAAEKAASDSKADKADSKTDKADSKADKAARSDATPTNAKAAASATIAALDAAEAPPASPSAAAPAATPPAPEKPASAPLTLRPEHALEPAGPTPTLGLGTKLAIAALIGGGAFFVYKRRTAVRPTKKLSSLRVTARAAIGTRSEVCVVEIDGQRLLLGVTPSSIRTLTVLTEEAMIEQQELGPSPIEEGFKRLLASAHRDVDQEPETEADADVAPDHGVRRLHAAPASRPVPSARSGRPAVLPESSRPSMAAARPSSTGRPTIASPTARTVENQSAPTKKTGRRSAPTVEGQVSGLLTMRSGRS